MPDIPFKTVVVDMDGTFVDKNNYYNKKEFEDILNKLHQKGCHFLVASGRPAARLFNDFAGFTDRIDFVADNGAVLIRDQKIIKATSFSKAAILKITQIIAEQFPAALPVTLVSGVQHTYCLKNIPDDKKKLMFFFYPNTIGIDDFKNIPDDKYTKVTISYPNTIGKELEATINQNVKEQVKFTTSGFENIDLVLKGTKKQKGLKELLKYLKVKPNDVIAFGDSGNDIEMLKESGISYCMANGTAEAKKAAKFIAPANTEDGVFKVLYKYLDA